MEKKYSYKLRQFDPDHLKESITYTFKKLYNGKIEPCYVKHLIDRAFIREVREHKGTLDNRRKKQNLLYLALGIVERDPTDVSKILSPGKTRGIHKSDITHYTPSSYHTSFNDWFSLHIKCAEKYSIDRQNSNQMYVKGDKRKLTTREYCSVIDTEMTGEWIDENVTTRQPERISECLISGLKTFAGRFAAAMRNKNELMTMKQWKRQTAVIISLSVYLLVLDDIYHKQRRACGLKHAATMIISKEQVKDGPFMSVHPWRLCRQHKKHRILFGVIRKRRIKRRKFLHRLLADPDKYLKYKQRPLTLHQIPFNRVDRHIMEHLRLNRRRRFDQRPLTTPFQMPLNRYDKQLMKRLQSTRRRRIRMMLK